MNNTEHFGKLTERMQAFREEVLDAKPYIDAQRAVLATEAYKENQNQPRVMVRALMLQKILEGMSIYIDDKSLIAGNQATKNKNAPIFPEYTMEFVMNELDLFEKRDGDVFYITEETKEQLREIAPFWENNNLRARGEALLPEEVDVFMETGVFGMEGKLNAGDAHLAVNYQRILSDGLKGYEKRVKELRAALDFTDPESIDKNVFYKAVLTVIEAVRDFAQRYSKLAKELADKETDAKRKEELLQMSKICAKVPYEPANSFREAVQSVWFIQLILQIESNGHSLSYGRFDQYMYPYYKKDMEAGTITREFAQELMDCIWVKLNDLNKCRDAASAEGFAGYSLFQNLIAGGQNKEGEDVTNDLSIMCIQASMHVHLPAPSLSVRVWNGSPHEFLIKAAELTRTGIGLPAYYNDEVIIPALQNRGLSLEDAREYNIIGCVEPQKAGKTEGWHDAAFFNMCRPLELVFSNGMDKGEMVGIPTGDVTQMKTFDEFFDAYKKQMEYCISLLVNADNAIDVAHAERCPLPFLSCMIDDCLKEGKSVQEGGAVYNFTGPQGFGIANMADGLFAIRKLVYEDKKVSMKELKEALAWNYDKGLDAQSAGDMTEMIMKAMQKAGRNVDASTAEGLLKTFMGMKPGEQKTQRFKEIHDMIDEVPKFGNDIPEVDYFAREVAYTYSKPLQKYNNPRGGKFQAGLYPVSANVPLGGQTGATPDGRYAHTPVADGVSPSAGKDVKGPTAAATSVSRLDHFIVSNGTLFNQKFHPSALSGREGLEKFVALIRGYFDQKGMHMQFNVVDRQTLLDAQEHPEKYKHLVVRVAGYSALFTTLSRSLQDDIIRRTEQGF